MKVLLTLFTLAAIGVGYFLYDKFDPEVIDGKRVLITGGSMGIGEQTAYQYARLGANVMVVARSEDRLKKVVEKCRDIGRPDRVYLYQVADLSNPEQTGKIIEAAASGMGGIDYLVLNHMMTHLGAWEGSAENMTRLRNTLELNFFVYVRLASEALPILQQSSGSIVVLSSLAGRTGQIYLTPYSTSKFALDGFFSGLRMEQRARNTGVSVTICIIGLVDTESAVKTLRDSHFTRVLDSGQAANASDVAYDILRAAALREAELYSPYWSVQFGLTLNFLSPRLYEMLLLYLFEQT